MLLIVNDNETNIINCAILVLNYSAVGYITPKSIDPIPAVLPFNISNKKCAKFRELNTRYNGREWDKKNHYSSEWKSDTMQRKRHNTCSGECCSVNGIILAYCIVDILPVDNIKIEDIMYDCDYAKNMNPDSMSNFDKSLVLQWWFCANVYINTQKLNLEQLPCCLISEIERLYPYDYAGVSKMVKSSSKITSVVKRSAD